LKKKSRRVGWAGHVVRVEEMRGEYRFWSGNLRERYHLEYPGINGKIIKTWIFGKWDVGVWTELI